MNKINYQFCKKGFEIDEEAKFTNKIKDLNNQKNLS